MASARPLRYFFGSLALLALALAAAPQAAHAATVPFDLRTWSEESPDSQGEWLISPDGSSAVQTENGQPSFLVSPESWINTTIRGQFKVQEGSDNDFIGVVFGYQSPSTIAENDSFDWNFLLFDWKKNLQTTAEEGFRLAKIDRVVNAGEMFSISFASQDVFASRHGNGTGWRPYLTYDFSLLYQTNRLKIEIDGTTIFDIKGEFQAGRFGFYNFSQKNAVYSGFTATPTAPEVEEEETAKSVPETPSSIALVGIGVLAVLRRFGIKIRPARRKEILS